MKTFTLIAVIIAGGATAAAAGGFNAPVAQPAPTAETLAGQMATDWTGLYGGLQFGMAEAEAAGIEIEGRHYGLHIGYLRDFGAFVGGAELSYDKLDDFEVAGMEVDDLGVDSSGSLVRAKLLAGYDAGRILPYAAVSLARGTLEVNGEEESETGFGYGIGAKFMVTPRFMAGVEWMRNSFETSFDGADRDLDVDTIGVSASYRF